MKWTDIRDAYEAACDKRGIEYSRDDKEHDRKFWQDVANALIAPPLDGERDER